MCSSPTLRDVLIAYLLCDSPQRARIISELVNRNPGILKGCREAGHGGSGLTVMTRQAGLRPLKKHA